MSLHRRNPRRDASEPEVISALEACDFTVMQISAKGKPDLVIGRNGVSALVECKTGRKGLNQAQEMFWMKWAGNGRLVLRSADEALALAKCWPKVMTGYVTTL